MILVIGATGNVGREIVPQLLDLNQPVRVFVRDKRKVSHLANRVEIALGDLQQPETIEHAVQGIDKVFLVLNDMRTLFAKNVVNAAKSAGASNESLPASRRYNDRSRASFGGQAISFRHWFVPVSNTNASGRPGSAFPFSQ